jgi:hypothetical protein
MRDKQLYIQELEEFINRIEKVESSREKEDENTQDAGTILTIVLGSSAVVAVAKGVSNWLVKHRDVQLEITKGDTKMKVNNLTTDVALEILEKFKEIAD